MKRHKKSGKGIYIALGVIAVTFALVLFFPLPGEEEKSEPEPTEVSLTIRCVGDIMGHLSQLIANYDSASGLYDFSGDYAYVQDYIQEADLALCNVETTFLGDGDYKGYPYFNSPDQLAADIAGAGFDVALFSNNHILDTKLAGLQRSLTVLREAGMKTAGARKDGESRVLIVSAGAINIGVASYTYETGVYQGHRTLNGSIIPEGAENYFNSFRPYALQEDLQTIAADIRDLKEQGADIVVTYFHWGDEYKRNASSSEQEIAQFAAEAGADIIFASHPHVVQEIREIVLEEEIEEIPSEEPVEIEKSWIVRFREKFGIGIEEPIAEPIEEGPQIRTRVVPVFYSMGNFISNQREETLDNRYTEQGMIASVNLTYVVETGEIKDVETRFIPTWVEKYNKNGKADYAIIPLVGDFRENPDLLASGHVNRAQQALDDMIDLIGGAYLYQYEYGAE